MTHSLTHTLTRGDFDFEIEVEYSVAPLIGAVMPSWNDPGTPAEGGEVTSLEAFLDGEAFPLTDEEERAIEAVIFETHDYSDDDFGYWEE